MSAWASALDGALSVVRDTFRASVSYSPLAGGGPLALVGVFDEAHEAIDLSGELPVSTTRPALWVKLADFTVLLAAPPMQDDTLVLVDSGRTFEVSDVQVDGAGGATLFLLET